MKMFDISSYSVKIQVDGWRKSLNTCIRYVRLIYDHVPFLSVLIINDTYWYRINGYSNHLMDFFVILQLSRDRQLGV